MKQLLKIHIAPLELGAKEENILELDLVKMQRKNYSNFQVISPSHCIQMLNSMGEKMNRFI